MQKYPQSQFSVLFWPCLDVFFHWLPVRCCEGEGEGVLQDNWRPPQRPVFSVVKGARRIVSPADHILSSDFILMPSGHCLVVQLVQTNRRAKLHSLSSQVGKPRLSLYSLVYYCFLSCSWLCLFIKALGESAPLTDRLCLTWTCFSSSFLKTVPSLNWTLPPGINKVVWSQNIDFYTKNDRNGFSSSSRASLCHQCP